jgi:YbbR domain-containing protein
MAAKSALEVLKRIGLAFRRNWGLKLASLFFAVILWNYAITEVNPIRTVTFSDVRVTFDPGSITQLHNSGFTVKGALPEKTITVSVDIRRNEASLLNRDQIQAVASLAGITSDGPKMVTILVTPPRGTVKNTTQNTIRVEIERQQTRSVPVVWRPDGSLPETYWRGEPVITPNKLQISGANSVVSRVDHAEIVIPLSGLTSKLSAARDFRLLDSGGKEISLDGITVNPTGTSCIVNLDVYPTKTVSIVASGSYSGKPARGYEIRDIVTVPSEITIAGPQETLDTISVLTPEPIEINGSDSDVSGFKKFTLPKGVQAVGESTVLVHAFIEEKKTTVTLNNLPVAVDHLKPGLKADTRQARVDVTVTCPELTASKIKAGKVRLYVDATGLDARSYTLKVQAEYDAELGITDFTASPESILVTITAGAA